MRSKFGLVLVIQLLATPAFAEGEAATPATGHVSGKRAHQPLEMTSDKKAPPKKADTQAPEQKKEADPKPAATDAKAK
jgi:hypothetical protein